MKPYGLVLAGGGAKGAYQIGAWKALRELHVPIEAITGVSIGAINGALIAQGDYDRALELWTSIEVKSGVNLPSELREPENLFSFSNLPQIVAEMVRNGGVDVTPARELLCQYVNEAAVRASGIPLGLVTFQVTGFKPIELYLDEIEDGFLIDYLMLSARFPGLHNDSPDGERYLDGGFYDNAPIELLRRRGCNRFIVIDISGVKGLGHRSELANGTFVYVRPNEPKALGEPFEFDKSMTQMRMDMGYLDTMKAFGKLCGRQYYFKPAEFQHMQEKYGYEAVYELENFAESLAVETNKVYTEKQFMRTVLKACKKYAQTMENKGLSKTILRVAQPILEKAPEELLEKLQNVQGRRRLKRVPKRKKAEKFAKAQSALQKFSAESQKEKELRQARHDTKTKI